MKDFLDKKLLEPSEITRLSGYLYVQCVGDLYGFITSNSQLIEYDFKIVLPVDIIKSIIEQDDIFGVLVGGEYFYFAMPVQLEHAILSYNHGNVYLDEVDKMILSEDGMSKTINF